MQVIDMQIRCHGGRISGVDKSTAQSAAAMQYYAKFILLDGDWLETSPSHFQALWLVDIHNYTSYFLSKGGYWYKSKCW